MDTSKFIERQENLEKILSDVEKYDNIYYNAYGVYSCLKNFKDNLILDIKAMRLYATLTDTWNKQFNSDSQRLNQYIEISFSVEKGINFSLTGKASDIFYNYIYGSLSDSYIFIDSMVKKLLEPFDTNIKYFNELLYNIQYKRYEVANHNYNIDKVNDILCDIIKFLKSDNLKNINPGIEAYIKGLIKCVDIEE